MGLSLKLRNSTCGGQTKRGNPIPPFALCKLARAISRKTEAICANTSFPLFCLGEGR